MRVLYRLRQFWLALSAVPAAQDLILARQALSPAQMALFQRMQASEQAHSLWVFRQLRQAAVATVADQAPGAQDLLAAALLHDVGKIRYPLRLWERVLIVLGKAFFPQKVQRWGLQPPHGWQRPFVVAAQHPAWGAEMAAQAGASPLAAALIRRHQERLEKPAPGETLALEDQLLLQLQRFDEER